MWIVAVGTTLSAYFILVANSWVQHPVDYTYDAARRIDELSSFLKVLVNPAQLAGFPHVLAGCFLTAGALVAGVMKMASAEALYHTSKPAPFSLLTIGNLNGTKPVFQITLPRLLSFLATGNWSGTVQGIDNLQAHYSQVYGPGSYTPVVPVVYWSFRLMIGVGLPAALIALPKWPGP
jgi:cytochrome bd ubiquinol oxidase subunit I